MCSEYGGMILHVNMNVFRKEQNFRDLGGCLCEDGRYLRRGLLYRSGRLDRMNAEEISAFSALHIRNIVDLRSREQALRRPDPVFEGTEEIPFHCEVSKGGEGIDFSSRGMLQSGKAGRRQIQNLLSYYEQMPFDNCSFHVLIQLVAERKVPLLFHCASGKDRTGTAAMIILLMMGVPEKTVLQDYLASNIYRSSAIDKTMHENREKADSDPVLKQLILMKEGVSEEIGRSILKSILEQCGTYENYFMKEYGYNRKKLSEIRDFYLKEEEYEN